MKTTINLLSIRINLILAAMLLCGLAASGQTTNTNPPASFSSGVTIPPQLADPTISGGLQQIYDAALGSTNFAIAFGGGRAIHGNHTLGFVDYLYNFNGNAGLILGYDYITDKTRTASQNLNFVKGGFNVQAQIAPLKNFGLTNLLVTPFASILIDSSGGQIGQIVVAGANYEIGIGKGWNFNLGGFYENRSGGNTAADGVYICGELAISRKF